MDNLSRDMIQCKAEGFGVRYGHWHAAKEERERQAKTPPKENPVPAAEKTELPRCVICGKEIPQGRKKTCGAACADILRTQNYRETERRRRQKKMENNS